MQLQGTTHERIGDFLLGCFCPGWTLIKVTIEDVFGNPVLQHLERFAIARDRVIGPPHVLESVAEIRMAPCVVWIDLQGLAIVTDRFFKSLKLP